MFDDALDPPPATSACGERAPEAAAGLATLTVGGPRERAARPPEQPSGWSSAELTEVASGLAGVDLDVSDVERVDQLRALEHVKSACAAVQARITARFVDSQAELARQWHERAGACADDGDFDAWRAAREQARRHEAIGPTGPADTGSGLDGIGGRSTDGAGRADTAAYGGPGTPDRGGPGDAGSVEGGSHGSRRRRRRQRADSQIGAAAQVGLARRESPSRGARLVGQALALTGHLPHTLAALEAGLLSEYRASLVVTGTSHLSTLLAGQVDALVIGANGDAVGTWGSRELEARVRACADRLDAAAAAERARVAETRRRVTLRPVPDTMAMLTAVLPAAQAIAVHATLARAAAAAIAAGDPRTRDQLMADTLVALVTGQQTATDVPIEVQVIITDRALFAGDDTPAHLPGYGPVPAAWVRHLLAPDPDEDDDDASAGTDLHPGDAGPTSTRPTSDATAADPEPAADADPTTTTEDRPTGGRASATGGPDADLPERKPSPPPVSPDPPLPPPPPASDSSSPHPPSASSSDPRPPSASPPPPQSPAPPQSPPSALQAPAPWWGQQFTPTAPPDRAWRRAGTWLRRLYTDPTTGTLVGMDSRRRLFDAGLRRFLVTRDGHCRTPYCDAPIRHLDHIQRWADGGPTTAGNGQGLSERCNHVKDLPGWGSRVTHPGPGMPSGPQGRDDDGHPHTVQLRTPTGHTYTSTAPPVLPELRPQTPTPRQAAIPDVARLSPYERVLALRLAG